MRVTQALCATKAARIATRLEQLKQCFRRPKSTGGPGSRTRHDSHRRDIISQDLCDSAIAVWRSTGSLPEKGACDIIEVNPGFSQWTETLHKELEPRRHILVEPEGHVYGSYLEELLNKNGSCYRVASTLTEAFNPSSKLLSPKFLKRHEAPSTEQRRSLNGELILVANLVRERLFTTRFVGTFSKMFLNQFYRATLDDTGMIHFHQHGLIKLLAWVSESDRTTFLSTSAHQRTKLARELEAAYHIRAIVATDLTTSPQKRPWYDSIIQSRKEVAKRDSTSKLKLPRSRRQPVPLPDTDVIEPIAANFSRLRFHPYRPRVIDEFFAAYDAMHVIDPTALKSYIDGMKRARASLRHLFTKSPDLHKLAPLFSRLRIAYNHYNRVNKLVREQIGYEKELLDLRRADPEDPAKYLARLEELKPKFLEVASKYRSFFKDDRSSFIKAVDDLRLLLHQAIPWHKREFEPVLCHPNDFYPEKPMTLLEFTPKTEFTQRVNTGDRLIAFDFINSSSFAQPVTTVDNLIASLVGSKDTDVYNDFLSKLPGLTDPLHGGYWDLSDVRIRTLSAEQIIDIALVYEAWPYRKATNDMLSDTQRSVRKSA